MSQRRVYSYRVSLPPDDPGSSIKWVVAPSRESADAVMSMEYIGMKWTYAHHFDLNRLDSVDLSQVDHWVGRKLSGR